MLNTQSTVSSLAAPELRRRCAGTGLVLRTGPFSCRVRTDIPHLVDTIALLYADYPLAPDDGFADFDVTLRRSGGLRRWFHPQVGFEQDGITPFLPLPLAQAHPMFEWVMNWCVSTKAHSYLLIHAAVLERDGCAVILPAPPGSGKSTLCAALASRGWRLLSDEMTLVRPTDVALVPMPRPVSLKNASIGVMQAFAPQAVFGPAVPETVKGTIAHMRPSAASIAAAGRVARPTHIMFPRYQAGAATSLAPMPKARMFMGVADNAFNYPILGATGFDTLARMVDACEGFEFCYSSLDEAMAVFDGLAGSTAPLAAWDAA
ncbi:HprK-related kinase A [Telluria aromaticivorans]|uniref:HprK-related kinase A n=1 Tax=Telluria aromaticivorans TaxID=2725995 RepID=A0A7Y2P0H2_9BURK|nr:HprK-related kinase A [Telluria aromaticivorans]NNG24193.1 HprK-related kinase A [Telluria aromaticivorans]